MHTYIQYIHIISGKKFKTDGNQKFLLAYQANFLLDFGLISIILHRVLPLCIVFSPLTTVTSCQDADFFPGMIHIHTFFCIICHRDTQISKIYIYIFPSIRLLALRLSPLRGALCNNFSSAVAIFLSLFFLLKIYQNVFESLQFIDKQIRNVFWIKSNNYI